MLRYFDLALCGINLVRNSLTLQIFIFVLGTLLDPANKETVISIYSVLKLIRCSFLPQCTKIL